VNDEFVEHRVREIEAFERRARGENGQRRPPTSHNLESKQMLLFEIARPTSAYLKMGIMGKQASGKSKTAAKVAIGLVNYLKELGIDYAEKPALFFDTETGSDYLIPDFNAAGIPLIAVKKRALADLLEAMAWAEANASVLIIDSITHPYREMIAAYLKKKNRSFLQIDDWNYLKGDHGWQQFTDRFINSKIHIIMCGRAGDDLEQFTDENGKRQLEKIGTKMKGEAETGFEPSLLVLMELLERRVRGEAARTSKKYVNRATIVKDRWDKINGTEIDFPDFKSFLPHIELLNLGGQHVGVDMNSDSQHILVTEKRDWQPVQRKIVLGETQDLLLMHAPGQTVADKQRRITLLKSCFGAGWVEIEETMSLPDLRAGYDLLHQELEGKPSKYGTAIAKDAQSNEINDSLPEFAVTPAAAAA
jgi:hypothetical protein